MQNSRHPRLSAILALLARGYRMHSDSSGHKFVRRGGKIVAVRYVVANANGMYSYWQYLCGPACFGYHHN